MLNKETISEMLNRASNTELEIFWIPKIISNQTRDEERSEETIEHNRIGLNGADGKIITSIYHQIQRGKHLSERQAFTVKKRLRKYWKQYSNTTPETKRTIIKPEQKEFSFNLSDEHSDCCKNPNIIFTAKHTDDEGDITHWDAICKNCKATGTVFND